MAARCKAVMKRSPQRKRLHVRSKRMVVGSPVHEGSEPQDLEARTQIPVISGWVVISLPLSLEVTATREELDKVAILSVVEGYVNESSVLEVALAIINR